MNKTKKKLITSENLKEEIQLKELFLNAIHILNTKNNKPISRVNSTKEDWKFQNSNM